MNLSSSHAQGVEVDRRVGIVRLEGHKLDGLLKLAQKGLRGVVVISIAGASDGLSGRSAAASARLVRVSHSDAPVATVGQRHGGLRLKHERAGDLVGLSPLGGELQRPIIGTVTEQKPAGRLRHEIAVRWRPHQVHP